MVLPEKHRFRHFEYTLGVVLCDWPHISGIYLALESQLTLRLDVYKKTQPRYAQGLKTSTCNYKDIQCLWLNNARMNEND